MKVAVITNNESQVGRSSFIITLASVFSRTQHRKVTIYSTAPMSTMLDMVEVQSDKTAVNATPVLKALIESKVIRGEELYNYSLRIGKEEVYAFDVYDNTYSDEETSRMINAILRQDTTDLSLIEVVGSIEEEHNAEVLSKVDVVLCLFNHSIQSIKAAHDFMQNLPKAYSNRTFCICAKYDADVVSERKLAIRLGINVSNLMLFPYNKVVARAALNHELNKIGELIAKLHFETIDLCPKMLEIMQFLFDTQKHKYIKGVKEWYK